MEPVNSPPDLERTHTRIAKNGEVEKQLSQTAHRSEGKICCCRPSRRNSSHTRLPARFFCRISQLPPYLRFRVACPIICTSEIVSLARRYSLLDPNLKIAQVRIESSIGPPGAVRVVGRHPDPRSDVNKSPYHELSLGDLTAPSKLITVRSHACLLDHQQTGSYI
jgi:hypothetical protein